MLGEGGSRREGFNAIKQRHLLGNVINTQPLKKTAGRDATFGEHLKGKKKNHMHKEFKRKDN